MQAKERPADPREERLQIEFPDDERAPAELPRRGKLVLGSSRERADLVVTGEGVEPVHCTIRRLKGGGWALVDMGSEIGTRVNGRIVETVRLGHGDTISMGPARLQVVDPGTARPRARTGNGVRISGYRIERILGRGGMGQVYLALQERLDRQVALKVLPPKLAADSEFVRRFQAEARAAAALNHPNVVTIYDVGEENGKHFLSMEYMHQGCLESRLARDGRLPWPLALEVLHDAASGLEYAESRGIVHRDIKPANLMQNEDGMTKIADLGLAVQAEQAPDDEEGERILGTPHFIAPELIRGEKPDSRSDLYSLGATAYRLVTGHTPFEGQTAREILRRALHDKPRPVRELAPDVPEELQATIERLLSRSPTERHPSATILLQEIRRMREGHGGPGSGAPGAGRPASASSALGKFVALALVLVVLGGAGWFLRSYLSLPEDTTAARETSVSATGPDSEPGFEGLAFDESLDAELDTAADDDMAARLLEAEAEVEYLKLGELTLTDEERETRLLALGERYKGTNSGYRAVAEAEASREARVDALARSREDDAAIRETLAAARTAAEAIDAQRARSALGAVQGVAVPAGIAGDRGFLAGRRAIEVEALSRAIQHTRGVLERADELASRGDFDALRDELDGFCQSVELLEAGEGETLPEQAQTLERLATRAYTRLSNLDQERVEWLRRQEEVDRNALAAGFRGPGGLSAQLAVFDFEGASNSVREALETVRTQEARASLTQLADSLDQARGALEALARAWQENAWRRKSIADPRASRATNRDAVGADARGLLVAADGATEHVPWSEWAGQPRALHVLFNERLERPWSGPELEGIATLLRLAAVSNAAAWASTQIDPSGPPRARGGEAEELLESFDQARAWADQAGADASLGQALDDERAAVALLMASLASAEEGSPAVAVARLERLLAEYPHTLFVQFLSDGSGRSELERGAAAPPSDALGDGPGVLVKPSPGPGGSEEAPQPGEPDDGAEPGQDGSSDERD